MLYFNPSFRPSPTPGTGKMAAPTGIAAEHHGGGNLTGSAVPTGESTEELRSGGAWGRATKLVGPEMSEMWSDQGQNPGDV